MEMGGGYHAINPTAAIYWNPANTATGNYTLKGTFKLMKPSGHTNYYGLFFGGLGVMGILGTASAGSSRIWGAGPTRSVTSSFEIFRRVSRRSLFTRISCRATFKISRVER